MRALLDHLALCQFKSQQHLAADFSSVFDGLQAGGERSPLVLAEVRMGCTGGEDEIVVRELSAGAE